VISAAEIGERYDERVGRHTWVVARNAIRGSHAGHAMIASVLEIQLLRDGRLSNRPNAGSSRSDKGSTGTPAPNPAVFSGMRRRQVVA
jgi:hypothetical protein